MSVKINTARVFAFNVECIAPGDTFKQICLGCVGANDELVFIERLA